MFSNYDVNDNMTVYFDVFHNGFFSFDYGNTSGYPYSTWAFGSGQDFPPTIGIDNPFLTQNSVDIMNSYGATEVYVHKSHVDLLQKGDGGYTKVKITGVAPLRRQEEIAANRKKTRHAE